MPFTSVEDEKKPDEVVAEVPPGETPPAETPPAEVPPEEPPKTFTLTAEELEKEVSKGAAGARRAERQRSQKIETENAALKKRLEVGQRPSPPDSASFVDPATGEIDRTKHQSAVVQYEDKLHAWRQAQGELAPTGSEAGASPGPTLEDFKTRYEPMKQKHADYEEVINRPVFTREIMEALFESEQGPEIAYFLGNNESEALRIADLSPAQVLKEIGKLEVRFSAAPSTRIVSGAPAPITPVTGTTTVEKDPEKMTTPEWMAYEKQQRVEKIKRGQTALGG